ncbi:hypothetical protein CTA1_6061 [Colletotrichum tanaceti]|uniref:Uncharacterized protein n=1 Tax=Colletotrichum tanaceti TaxID=1306861 RepID=A0A4U6X2I2_9PEZI|nr:hypothetical protein CTA1_6061 [Colletotrichum tanaceti]
MVSQSVWQGKSSARSQTHPSVRPLLIWMTLDLQTPASRLQPAMAPKAMEATTNADVNLMMTGYESKD